VIKTRIAAIFLAVALGIGSMPRASDAEGPRKIPRVGLINTGPDCQDKTDKMMQAFTNGLRERGYIVGQISQLTADCFSLNATISFERSQLAWSVGKLMPL
jgi:hypothetical protein